MNRLTNISPSIKNKIALIITLYFPPEIGGGSTGSWNRALILNNLGYTVFILTAFPSYPSGKIKDPKYKRKFFFVETSGNFKIFRIRLPSLSHNGYFKPLIIFTSFVMLAFFYLPLIYKFSKRPSIIYSRSPVLFSSLIGLFYSKIMGSKYIYEVPDLWPEELFFKKSIMSNFLLFLGKGFAKLSYYFPDKIVTVSESAKDYINEHYQPKAKVYGIPVGVDQSKFKRIRKGDARKQLIDLSVFHPDFLDKFIVMYSGRISVAQGVDCLAFAAEQLKNMSNILVLVIGEGPERNRLEQIKTEHNLDNFIILPPQKRDLMPIIISSVDVCTIFLSPDPIFGIALPTKFYEYISCFKPIIGICHGELAKLITNNRIGEVCDPEDPTRLSSIITNMNRSSDKIKSYEQNSMHLSNDFSIDRLSLLFKEVV